MKSTPETGGETDPNEPNPFRTGKVLDPVKSVCGTGLLSSSVSGSNRLELKRCFLSGVNERNKSFDYVPSSSELKEKRNSKHSLCRSFDVGRPNLLCGSSILLVVLL